MSFLELRRVTILLLLGIVCLLPLWITAQQKPRFGHRQGRDISSQKAAEAAQALLERSDLATARAAAQQVIRLNKRLAAKQGTAPKSLVEALFVEMEAAALQADTRAQLDAALRLCELAGTSDDPRVSIASSRILDLAGNTAEFRAAIPRIKALLNTAGRSELRAALLVAAADGAPGLSEMDLARQSGLITDWKIVGPVGDFSNVAFDRTWEPERDGLATDNYRGRHVEHFQFPSGEVSLPEYLSGDGVYYAAAQVKLASAGKYLLRVESPGTIQAWIDGSLVLTKDDRFHATAETVGVDTDLRAGTHRVVVKFLPSAVPFRVALVPSTARRTPQVSNRVSEIESVYISAAQAYWSGDYRAVNEQLLHLRTKHESAVVDLLLAQSLSHSGANTSDRTELLDSALKLAPDAYAARYELASIHFAKGEFRDAFEDASAVFTAQPRFEPAARLTAATASRLGLTDEAKRAFDTAVDLHASCAVLKDAAAFHESISNLGQASTYESKLRNCAPNSLAWSEALARTGHHLEASATLKQIVTASPLDRRAREMLVRELTLAGKTDEAREAVDRLAELAPNSIEYRRMAATLHSGGEASDSSVRGTSLADDEFYSTYRRDGVELVRQAADRKFSGGPLAVLLNERIAEVSRNGAASVYVHKISRVLDRDGINRYGEVTLPDDASLLELRTIKSDGTIVEPEFHQHKSTVSMPALAPGDAIDVEYVIRNLDGGVASHPELFQFTFGSFSAPTVFSRFIVLAARESNLKCELSGKVPELRVDAHRNRIARAWELNDIPQSTSENSMPASGVLPSIALLWSEDNGWSGVRDFYRDVFIDAIHESSRIQKLAQEFPGDTVEHRLRAAYNFVVSRIRKGDTDYESGDVATADNTLANYSGSRAAALLALAKQMGITGKILMARNVSLRAPEIPTPHAYTHPLVVFQLPDKGEIVLDPETNGMVFGGISAGLEPRDALVVPIYPAEDAPLIAAVPKPLASERSTAVGDVTFNENGDLTAHIEIEMGAARGAQMRNMLRGISPSGRKRFFEQLASRIFPGVTSADGSVQNETNTDSPLVLLVDCQASKFVDLSKPTTELDQLVPSLGLKKMYRTDGNRKTPLLVDTPLVEDSSFRITLPNGTSFLPLFNDANEQNDFGNYSVTFKRISDTTVEVRRAFDIPVQIISQDRFGSFAQFARNVDDAERQHLIVKRSSTQATNHGGQN